MTGSAILFSIDDTTLVLLSVALIIFSFLAVKSMNIKSFQFQISLFIVIWIIGEIADILQEAGIIETSNLENIGLEIHLASMAFFALMLWLRFYLSKRSGRKLIEDIRDYDR
jgi:hypothetical protein